MVAKVRNIVLHDDFLDLGVVVKLADGPERSFPARDDLCARVSGVDASQPNATVVFLDEAVCPDGKQYGGRIPVRRIEHAELHFAGEEKGLFVIKRGLAGFRHALVLEG